VSLLISTWSVFFTDFLDMYQLFLQAWFFLTPIIYPREIVPERFAWVVTANPMTHFADLFRMPLYHGRSRTDDRGRRRRVGGWGLPRRWLGVARKAHELAHTL